VESVAHLVELLQNLPLWKYWLLEVELGV
jgi:hypothetical protein